MNPFECDAEVSNNLTPTNQNITVWKESRGRKTNTYVIGWNLEKEDLSRHLKEFKKSKGCNGSLKENDDGDGFKLHFQGDKILEIIDFMESKGVNTDNITLKGQ
tara:strand:+ start:175 stop:486 length:312 start_codon:yes stop_codon:yes gene_type:complete